MDDILRKMEVLAAEVPLFRSDAQARLLAAIFLAPDDEILSIERLAALTGIPYASVHRDISRLLVARLVTDTRVGKLRRIRPNVASPYHDPLLAIIERAFGPPSLLRDAVCPLDGVVAVAIYGSWAARAQGQPGHAADDIDVLVVGSPDQRQLHAACRAVEARLMRPVNPTVVTRDEWCRTPSVFFDAVAAGASVEVCGDWSDLVRDDRHHAPAP